MTKDTVSSPRRVRRIAAVVVAAASLGVVGAIGVAAAQDDGPATACPTTQADLLRAAEGARQLQAQRPDLFEVSPQPAGYDDLRLAAEWAYRMSVLDPHHVPDGCVG